MKSQKQHIEEIKELAAIRASHSPHTPAPTAEKKHRTWESCHKHFACPDGEECWYLSEDYYWDCGNGASRVSEASQRAARKAREDVLGELSLPRDAVLRFSRIMETKLKERDGQRDGWEDCDPSWLFERAEDEMKELKKEIKMYMNHSSLSPKWLVIKERIQREAADVSNFCMMISDNMEPESLRQQAGEP